MFRNVLAWGLQFGHGTEPWRNHKRPYEQTPTESAFNSATARSRGETSGACVASTVLPTFNSATARSRGETSTATSRGRGRSCLQFGHGTESWRNAPDAADVMMDRVPSIRPRHGAVEKRPILDWAALRPRNLQFGHGTEPWRNGARLGCDRASIDPSIRPRHGAVEKPSTRLPIRRDCRSFNSATARSRGETLPVTSAIRHALKTFNSATARSRGETTGVGVQPTRRTDPSIRPRHGAVEKHLQFNPLDLVRQHLQFGHGTEPWRNSERTPSTRRVSNPFNSATARSGETALYARLRDDFTVLQFGHGTEPWRNTRSMSIILLAHCPSIRPRHGAVEKQNRELACWLAELHLQFGHGTEPWRNSVRVALSPPPSILQFGHGTEPWRNEDSGPPGRPRRRPSIRPRHGAVEKPPDTGRHGPRCGTSIRPRHGAVEKRPSGARCAVRPAHFNSATARSRGETPKRLPAAASWFSLQFGHGTEPWRNLNHTTHAASCPVNFNSATARSRGETWLAPSSRSPGIPDFNSATARSRGETSPGGPCA